jgi:pimeloyl-ACP methyl ester carboxylesterase
MRFSRKAIILSSALWIAALAAGLGFWLRPVSYFDEATFLKEKIAGVEDASVTVNGIRVHFEMEGPASGAAVVLIHGLGSRAEDWANLAPYFARAGYRVYLPDLPGYGRSERPAGFSYSIPDEADVVVGFLDAMGLKQVDLGGWSMGGWIVQLVAIRHPERVSRLMLFDSAGLYQKPTWDTNLFLYETPEQLAQLSALLMPDPPRIPGFVTRDILRIAKAHRWVMERALGSMLTGKDVTDSQLPQLKMPVLILWGELDQITPLSEGQTMHGLIPQSELQVFNGCGHLAPEQCSSAMGPVAVGFLQRP